MSRAVDSEPFKPPPASQPLFRLPKGNSSAAMHEKIHTLAKFQTSFWPRRPEFIAPTGTRPKKKKLRAPFQEHPINAPYDPLEHPAIACNTVESFHNSVMDWMTLKQSSCLIPSRKYLRFVASVALADAN